MVSTQTREDVVLRDGSTLRLRPSRHAEALEAYRQGHRLLAEEQGLEPCAELRRLELEILRQEPSLGIVDRVSG